MTFFEQSVFFGVSVSLAAYGIGVLLQKKFKFALFNPLLISVVLTIAVLLTAHISYDTFYEGAKYLSYLLTPATVCLAVPLYEKLSLLKSNWKAIFAGILSGVITTLCSVFVMSKLFHLTHEEYVTLLPSWKLDLIQAINDALEYADDRESFVENMEYEGYEVIWTDTRKHITFVCPDGRRCRDSSLHDETFLKENLETLFAYRQAVGFRPNTPEPEEGWMGELASELVRLGRSIEEADDLPPLPAPPAWTESKQRHREALKKLALGQKLSRGQSWQQTMW